MGLEIRLCSHLFPMEGIYLPMETLGTDSLLLPKVPSEARTSESILEPSSRFQTGPLDFS